MIDRTEHHTSPKFSDNIALQAIDLQNLIEPNNGLTLDLLKVVESVSLKCIRDIDMKKNNLQIKILTLYLSVVSSQAGVHQHLVSCRPEANTSEGYLEDILNHTNPFLDACWRTFFAETCDWPIMAKI